MPPRFRKRFISVYRVCIDAVFLDKFDRPSQSSPCEPLKIGFFCIPLSCPTTAVTLLQRLFPCSVAS